MEKYSLYELRNNLFDKVNKIGISQKLKENPSFQDVIYSIEGKIDTMNVGINAKDIEVTEDNKNISFEYNFLGKKYSLLISNINEMIAKVDDNGNLIISENFSLLDNENCSDKEVNNFTTSERKTFNKNGIMIEREFKSFGENKLQENINDVKIDSALYIPRSAFELASDFNDKYVERTLLRREMLDTARLIYKDNLNEIEYQTTVKLNEYNGLKNMSIQGYQDYPDDIVISPISKFEIDQKIIREENPKVQEGLREFSIGREEYNYNSKEDQHFIRNGVEETRNRYR